MNINEGKLPLVGKTALYPLNLSELHSLTHLLELLFLSANKILFDDGFVSENVGYE